MDAGLADGVEKAQGRGVEGDNARTPDSVWKGGILILCGGMWPFEKLQCLLEGERGFLQDTLCKPFFYWVDSCPSKDTSHSSSLHDGSTKSS